MLIDVCRAALDPFRVVYILVEMRPLVYFFQGRGDGYLGHTISAALPLSTYLVCDKVVWSVIETSDNSRDTNRTYAQYICLFDAHDLAFDHGCTVQKALA